MSSFLRVISLTTSLCSTTHFSEALQHWFQLPSTNEQELFTSYEEASHTFVALELHVITVRSTHAYGSKMFSAIQTREIIPFC